MSLVQPYSISLPGKFGRYNSKRFVTLSYYPNEQVYVFGVENYLTAPHITRLKSSSVLNQSHSLLTDGICIWQALGALDSVLVLHRCHRHCEEGKKLQVKGALDACSTFFHSCGGPL